MRCDLVWVLNNRSACDSIVGACVASRSHQHTRMSVALGRSRRDIAQRTHEASVILNYGAAIDTCVVC